MHGVTQPLNKVYAVVNAIMIGQPKENTMTSNTPDIDVYGADWCSDCRQAKETLNRLGAAYVWHNIEQEEGATDKAVAISGQKHIPLVHFADNSFMVEPSANDLKHKLASE